MKELQLLETREVFGKELNIYGTAEEPLFLAKDVANWIEHSDVSMMIRKIDEDEKVSFTNPNNVCGGQNAWFLTENGLYEVLMQSRKPIAKQFKKEVKKILKEIRQYGYYAQGETLEEQLSTVKGGMQKHIERQNVANIEMLRYNQTMFDCYKYRVDEQQKFIDDMVRNNNYNSNMPYIQPMREYSIQELVNELREEYHIKISKNEIIHSLIFLGWIKRNEFINYLQPIDTEKIFIDPRSPISDPIMYFKSNFYYDLISYFKNAPRPLIYK